jgi:hypothetical protein
LISQAPAGESRKTERGSGGAAGRTGGVEAPCCGRAEEGGGTTSGLGLVWWAGNNDAFVGGPPSELWPASVGGPKLKWASMSILSWPFSTT